MVKRSLVERGTRGGVGASRGVGALVGASLLPALNPRIGPWPASLFYSLVESAGGLTQELCQAQDPGAIAMKI